MIRVRLPWPSARLSPNARLHWGEKAQAVKSARREAGLSVLHQTYATDRERLSGKRLVVRLEFVPKVAARRDLDNCIARMKGALDGIADALQADDSNFELQASIKPADKAAGYVQVTISAATEATSCKTSS